MAQLECRLEAGFVGQSVRIQSFDEHMNHNTTAVADLVHGASVLGRADGRCSVGVHWAPVVGDRGCGECVFR